MTPARTVRVLQSLDAPDDTTRFATQMARSAPPDVQQDFFSWRKALFGRYDVFHVHWPEFLFRAGSPARTVLKRSLSTLFVLRLLLARTPVVRTVHNESPHETGTWFEALLLRALDRRVTTYVVLNPQTRTPDDRARVLIPHGHYQEWFARYDRSEKIPGRILTCGLLRPYKGIEQLIDAFAALDDPTLELRVVGRPVDAAYAEKISSSAAAVPRTSLLLDFVSDAELVQEISAAELLVLPYTRMHNSGIVFVSLSLDRSVLVPRNSTNDWIADEVGRSWVSTFEGELTPNDISRALQGSRAASTDDHVAFEGRDWASVGRAYERVYQEVSR